MASTTLCFTSTAPFSSAAVSSTPIHARTQSCVIVSSSVSSFVEEKHSSPTSHTHSAQFTPLPLPVHHLSLHSPPRFSLPSMPSQVLSSLSVQMSSIHDEIKKPHMDVQQILEERSFWQSPYKPTGAHFSTAQFYQQNLRSATPLSPPPPRFHLQLDPPLILSTLPMSTTVDCEATTMHMDKENEVPTSATEVEQAGELQIHEKKLEKAYLVQKGQTNDPETCEIMTDKKNNKNWMKNWWKSMKVGKNRKTTMLDARRIVGEPLAANVRNNISK